MALEGLLLEQPRSQVQLSILSNLYGRGRVLDELNRRGTLAFLGAPDMPTMVEEALGNDGSTH